MSLLALLGRLLFLPDEVQRAAVLRLLQHRHESLGHRARHGRAARPGKVSVLNIYVICTLALDENTYFDSTKQVLVTHGGRGGAVPGHRVQQDRHFHLHGARGHGPRHPPRILGKYHFQFWYLTRLTLTY